MTKSINKKHLRLKKSVKQFLFIFFLLMCVFSVYIAIYHLKKDSRKAYITKDIITNIQTENVDNVLTEVKKLYEENNDLIGYLIIPGTIINYPVMYTGDDYYLRRSFNGEYLADGTLYIDKYNSLSPRDTNLIIYGHNMNNNGHMFNDLEKYMDESFYKEHKTFTYYTLEEKETYEIVAVFLSQVYKVSDNVFKYYKFYNALGEEDMQEYYNNIKKLSLYDTGVTLHYGDKLLTLSTCEYSKENGRLAVVARKVS